MLIFAEYANDNSPILRVAAATTALLVVAARIAVLLAHHAAASIQHPISVVALIGTLMIPTLPALAQVPAPQNEAKPLVVAGTATERAEPEEAAILTSILLDRKEFLLGESIAADFEMTNDDVRPAPYGMGGFFPTLRINDAYRMSAVRIDEQGKAIGPPVANWPMPQNFGGPSGPWNLQPGESHSTTLFVTRYLRFLQPGRYKLTIENVDRFNKKKIYASAETFLRLKQPTAEQAREVYQRMKQSPRQAWDDGPMKFLADAADFETMHQPVYLPVLKEFAEQGDPDALSSLQRMESLEANEVLVAVIARMLDRGDWKMARACFEQLKPSLPFPNWYDEINAKNSQADRQRVARMWKSDFNSVLTRLARRLIPEVATSQDDKLTFALSMAEAQALLSDIDYIFRCIGGAEDFGDCLKAYEMSIELTKTLPLETHQYFRPRGSAFGFGHTVVRMLQRGAKPPFPPTHRGEAAAFVIALRAQKDFRPAGWQDEVTRWAGSDTPYVQELVLENTPEPQRLLDLLPKMLADSYVDLAIAACHVAKANPREEFHAPIEKILNEGREEHLLNAAAAAGPPNGLTNDKILEIWLSRMDNDDLGGEAMVRLLLTILEDNRASSEKELSPDAAANTKARWRQFIAEHRDRLRAGHKFKITDPEITPDLFPPGFRFYRDGKPWPPDNRSGRN